MLEISRPDGLQLSSLRVKHSYSLPGTLTLQNLLYPFQWFHKLQDNGMSTKGYNEQIFHQQTPSYVDNLIQNQNFQKIKFEFIEM